MSALSALLRASFVACLTVLILLVGNAAIDMILTILLALAAGTTKVLITTALLVLLVQVAGLDVKNFKDTRNSSTRKINGPWKTSKLTGNSIPYKTYQPNFEGNSVNGPVQGLAAAGGCNSVYSLAIRKSLVRENAKGHAQEAMQTGATAAATQATSACLTKKIVRPANAPRQQSTINFASVSQETHVYTATIDSTPPNTNGQAPNRDPTNTRAKLATIGDDTADATHAATFDTPGFNVAFLLGVVMAIAVSSLDLGFSKDSRVSSGEASRSSATSMSIVRRTGGPAATSTLSLLKNLRDLRFRAHHGAALRASFVAHWIHRSRHASPPDSSGSSLLSQPSADGPGLITPECATIVLLDPQDDKAGEAVDRPNDATLETDLNAKGLVAVTSRKRILATPAAPPTSRRIPVASEVFGPAVISGEHDVVAQEVVIEELEDEDDVLPQAELVKAELDEDEESVPEPVVAATVAVTYDPFAMTEEDFYAVRVRPAPRPRPVTRFSKPAVVTVPVVTVPAVTIPVVTVPARLNAACLFPNATGRHAVAQFKPGMEFLSAKAGSSFGPGPSFSERFKKRRNKPLASLSGLVLPPPPPPPSFPPGFKPPPPREHIPYLRLAPGIAPFAHEWGRETTMVQFVDLHGALNARHLPPPLVPDGARRVAYTLAVDHYDRPAHVTGSVWPLGTGLEELVIHVLDGGGYIRPSTVIHTDAEGGMYPAPGITAGQCDTTYRKAWEGLWVNTSGRTFFDNLAVSIARHLPTSRTMYTLRGSFAPHWITGARGTFEDEFVSCVKSYLPPSEWAAADVRITFPSAEEYERAVGMVGRSLETFRNPQKDQYDEWYDAGGV